MKKLILLFSIFFALNALFVAGSLAATPTPKVSPTATSSATPSPTPEAPRVDITQKTEEAVGPLEKILNEQKLGPIWPGNPIKYAIRGAIDAEVPANTIVLLLLLPLVAFVIALSRNVIGIRGFGIFLPAALSVTFVATGPVVGIGLFLLIVAISTIARMVLNKLRFKLQYLPRMAFILWAVVIAVLGVLFLAPVVRFPDLANVSIFAVLILVLLAEDFIRVQLGKSIKTALSLTLETLILSVVSYFFLTFEPLQKYVLLNPEIALFVTAVGDLALAKYSGLRLMEIWRFRKLLKN